MSSEVRITRSGRTKSQGRVLDSSYLESENRTELIEWGQRRKLFVGLGEMVRRSLRILFL